MQSQSGLSPSRCSSGSLRRNNFTWSCMSIVQLSHVSFSREFMYLVVEGAIPKYLGWWLDNIFTSLGHVNHEKEIVQWMGPSLTSAVLQEMCQLKYLRRNTSPPLSIHLSNTCSSFSFSDLSSLQHLYDMTMHELVIDNLPTPRGRPAFKRALHLHLDYKYCRKI